jgi:hypothetical protein
LRKGCDRVIAAEDLRLNDQGPGDVKALGFTVFFQPDAPIVAQPGGAGATPTGARQAVPRRSKGKILLDFISFISRLYIEY